MGYERKSGTEIGNFAVQEGIKGFGEGAISAGLAVTGGGIGGALVKNLGSGLLRTVTKETAINVVTGPIQQSMTSAWDVGFEALQQGKNPVDAMKAAWDAGSSELTSRSSRTGSRRT